MDDVESGSDADVYGLELQLNFEVTIFSSLNR